MTPAVGAVFMSASTVIVAINAKLLGRGGMVPSVAEHDGYTGGQHGRHH